MVEQLSKSDILLQDISEVYKQVSVVVNKLKDVSGRNIEIENLIIKVNEENEVLKARIRELEGDIVKLKEEYENNVKNSLNLEERETLRFKIQDLISRIDYHLSSDSQV